MPEPHGGAPGARRDSNSFGDSSSSRFGELRHTGEIQQDTTLVTDNPSVVSGRHEEEFFEAVLRFKSVVHPDGHTPIQGVSGGYGLASRVSFAVPFDLRTHWCPVAESLMIMAGQFSIACNRMPMR